MIGGTARELGFFTSLGWKVMPYTDDTTWPEFKEKLYRRVAHLPPEKHIPKEAMDALDYLYGKLEDYPARARDMEAALKKKVMITDVQTHLKPHPHPQPNTRLLLRVISSLR